MSGTQVVTLGESMVVFGAPSVGVLRSATSMLVTVAGAESNVAIGLRRLGVPTAWVGRVGADALGDLVLARVRGEGVDVSGAVIDPEAPTGLMVKERRTPELTRVLYYRAGSAGSRLRAGDLGDASIRSARLLHVTGITPALSVTARDAVDRAVAVAREAGVLVSLDYNYRSALWSSQEAAPVLRELTRRADLVFAGDDEAALVVGTAEPGEAAVALAALGPRHAVVKLGARGAVSRVDGESYSAPAVPVHAVDPVGAGDAFVAGYLADVLDGASPEACLRTGCRVGAFAVTVPGDWEGLPTRAELELLDAAGGTVLR